MIRQYFAHRFMGGHNPLHIGSIAVGSIYYLQDDSWWRDRFRGAPQRREPWIVDSFFNGTMGAARRDPTTGHWMSLYIAGRSDMALCRSLRTGRKRRVAVRLLHLHDDEGLSATINSNPDHPPPHLIDRYLHQRRLAA
jgi:hypothetical protein